MKRWEYKTISQKSRLNIPQLNECGADGWELVNVTPVPNTASFMLIFKRELDELESDGWNYCSEIKPSGYDDALPKYFQVAVKFTIASGTQTVTDICQACYIQEIDKWYLHENDIEPLYGEVYAWRELPKKPQLQ